MVWFENRILLGTAKPHFCCILFISQFWNVDILLIFFKSSFSKAFKGWTEFCGYLISQFYPTCEIRKNLMHVKNLFHSMFLHRYVYRRGQKNCAPFHTNHLVCSQPVFIICICIVWCDLMGDRNFWFFGSGTDLVSLFILLLLFLLWQPFKKNPRLRRFKSDRDEIWQDCSSSKYRSIDGVRILTWRMLQMAAVTSFLAECCHLLSAREASARRICSSVRHFLIRSTLNTYCLNFLPEYPPLYETNELLYQMSCEYCWFSFLYLLSKKWNSFRPDRWSARNLLYLLLLWVGWVRQNSFQWISIVYLVRLDEQIFSVAVEIFLGKDGSAPSQLEKKLAPIKL